jgi:hypothetical protein
MTIASGRSISVPCMRTRIESLGAPTATQTDSQLLWKEQPLELEKTKRGWVMTRLQDVAYVKREVALQVLSARLSELAQNTYPTPEQKAEHKEIVRLLNWLVVDDSRGLQRRIIESQNSGQTL